MAARKSLPLLPYTLPRPFHTSQMGDLFRVDNLVVRRVRFSNAAAIQVAEYEHDLAIKTAVAGVTPYRGVYGDRKYLYVTRDWQEGTSLEKLGMVPIDILISIIRAASKIVAACHAKGFAVADLKPANFVRREDGSLVLIELGGAAYFGRGPDMKDGATMLSVIVGTQHFSAPETLANNLYGPRGDVYGLGMLTGYLATGIVPEFDATEFHFPFTGQIRNLPLRAVVQKAISYNPRDRYTSVEEFHDALSQAVDAPSPSSTRPKDASTSVVIHAKPRLYLTPKFMFAGIFPVQAEDARAMFEDPSFRPRNDRKWVKLAKAAFGFSPTGRDIVLLLGKVRQDDGLAQYFNRCILAERTIQDILITYRGNNALGVHALLANQRISDDMLEHFVLEHNLYGNGGRRAIINHAIAALTDAQKAQALKKAPAAGDFYVLLASIFDDVLLGSLFNSEEVSEGHKTNAISRLHSFQLPHLLDVVTDEKLKAKLTARKKQLEAASYSPVYSPSSGDDDGQFHPRIRY